MPWKNKEMSEVCVDIGSRVKDKRRGLKISQEELARRAGVTLNAISQLERGISRDPHYSTLVGIAEALGISVGDLLGEPALAGKAEAPQGEPGPRRYVESVSIVGDARDEHDAGPFEPSASPARTQASIEEAQKAIEALFERSGVPVRYHTMPHEELNALFDAQISPEEAKKIQDEVWEERRKLDELCPDLQTLPGYPIHAVVRTRAMAAAGMLKVLRREEQQLEKAFERREATSPSSAS